MKTRIFAVCVVIVLFLGIANTDASTLSGLVSWWDADTVSGTTAFDIQDGNNATLMNGATTALGKVGKAFSLDGVDDYIVIADNANLRPTNAITVNAWVKFNSFPDGVAVHFIDRHNSGSGEPYEGYALACSSASPLPSLWIWTNPSNPIQNSVWGTTNIADDKFHHLAGTYDGSFVKIYVDGVLENSVSASGSIVYAGTLNLWLGASQQPSQFRRFKGLIDEVQIYNRALSASEIQQLYQGQGTCSTKVVTFTAGTPAKAAEVNANFDALNCQIQALKSIVCQDHPTADICK